MLRLNKDLSFTLFKKEDSSAANVVITKPIVLNEKEILPMELWYQLYKRQVDDITSKIEDFVLSMDTGDVCLKINVYILRELLKQRVFERSENNQKSFFK